MKRIISMVLCLMMLTGMTAAFAESNRVVLCFSATDNTWAIAEQVSDLNGADLVRIEPEVPYTDDDINWRVDDCRANLEQRDDTWRPGIANLPENIDGYDTVFLGFPIWWGTVPQIVKTLVESYNWEGKTIVPFCTSGSSGIATAISDLRALDSGAEVLETGRRFSTGASEEEIGAWLQEIGYGRDGQEGETMRRMIITVGDAELTVRLEDNASADALAQWLADGPQTIPASNYGGFEKVCPLGVMLPSDDAQTTTQPGDVMLYSSSQLVIFHGSNAWAYTRIGWIENRTQEELQNILGGDETEITLKME